MQVLDIRENNALCLRCCLYLQIVCLSYLYYAFLLGISSPWSPSQLILSQNLFTEILAASCLDIPHLTSEGFGDEIKNLKQTNGEGATFVH